MGAVTEAGSRAVPRLHDREWQLRAKCRDGDASLFFHPDGERGRARKRRQQLAREVCAGCPVARECGAYSISFQEAFGTWGGLSEDDRRRYLETVRAP
ncbi:WhiB family transcriptional regulator [Mycobacterium hackensackense]|jgi:WhiB family redox-sensing transcriptional regulator|uniref:WhiB family transcriptional regulator n=1 Tax=Mycobacterium hackensackense TaxID=228909 RepID=UPI0022659309|nr:WhiB family transcriptional regulator [Mycobacterium hackensackense]MCV7253714.1 WhiB family transcriptional regulator [Mycobacterium hackensackense]